MSRNLTAATALFLTASILIVLTTLAWARSREEGDRLQRKIDDIAANGEARSGKPRTTSASEDEINSYLAYNLREQIPRGLTQPEISLVGNGSLAGRVLVDIDDFKRSRGAESLMDPLSYVSGRVPITARGVLRTQDGRGRFYLASAELLGVPLPKPLVQELIGYFSRTPENPRGLDIDQPFDLPAKIRRIDIERGQAAVLQ